MSWEAEMSVLGGMMLDRECANLAADALSAEMFQDADLRKIFGRALDLYWEGKPIDGVLLTQEMPDLSGLILRTAEFVPKLDHFPEYVQIVQDAVNFPEVAVDQRHPVHPGGQPLPCHL